MAIIQRRVSRPALNYRHSPGSHLSRKHEYARRIFRIIEICAAHILINAPFSANASCHFMLHTLKRKQKKAESCGIGFHAPNALRSEFPLLSLNYCGNV